jgi:ankyrin repeat protein
VCKFILEKLDDKNPSDDYGQPPFHEAAAYGHIELCKLFIENGLDLKTAKIMVD